MWKSADSNDTDFLIRPDELARRLLREVRGRNLDPNKDSLWTDAVMESLNKIAVDVRKPPRNLSKDQLQTLHTSTRTGVHEFLLDYMWWYHDPDTGKQSCALAVESEWGDVQAVEDDFEKLLAFKSPIKMMIFSSHWRKTGDDLVGRIEECLRFYGRHEKGEVYLLVDFREDAKSELIKRFDIPNDLVVNDIELIDVSTS